MNAFLSENDADIERTLSLLNLSSIVFSVRVNRCITYSSLFSRSIAAILVDPTYVSGLICLLNFVYYYFHIFYLMQTDVIILGGRSHFMALH